MTIENVAVHTVHAPLKEPYTIAYETITEVTNHFVVITLEGGLCGIGCAAPAPEVTGESTEASRTALEAFAQDAVGADFDAWPVLPESTPSARAAVDLARHDILARSRSVSISGLYGDPDAALTPTETSITIGISSVEETLKRARSLYDSGFCFFKVKGGHDITTDILRLESLRSAFGTDIQLALDANQGYDLAAVEQLDSVTLDLLYLEQPTPKTELEMLGEAARRTSIPVMADESVQSADDVHRIAESGPVSLINIKLQKMGGLAAASAIDRASIDAGMGTMLGCMDESALSIAAALHFGATHPNVRFLDLDGHLDLKEDPFEELVQLKESGRLRVPKGNGLGWNRSPFGEARS